MSSNFFEQAKERGIVAPHAVDFMAFDDVNGRIVANAKKSAVNLAMDEAMITTPNVGAPAGLYAYLNPEIVEILFAKNAATELFTETKHGDFTTDFMQFPVEEVVGAVQPYSDFDHAVSTDVNYEYPVRENFRFQTGIKFGDLEVAKAAVAKISLSARKQNAAARVIKKAQNRFYLFGVQGKQTYGALNDPNLNAAISPIADANSNTTWAAKVAANPSDAGNIIFNDIAKLVGQLLSQTGGNVSINSRMRLGISNSMVSYLSYGNQFGKTALEMLKMNYPNIEVVQVPELSTIQGEELYLTVDASEGVDVGETAYADMFVLGRLIAHESSFTQKATSTTYGAVIKQPAFIATMTGIA